MSFTDAITNCMGKYFTFSGRARRSEFWWFYLFTILITWGAGIAKAAISPNNPEMAGIMSNIVSLAFLFPTLAVGSRRLHDIGRSGWWQLLVLTGIGIILLIVWWATDTKQEANDYGEVPEGKLSAAAAA